jgi:phosphonate transport system substrate-binding protein
MRSRRYRGKPIYFSDVVVRRDSPFQSLNDLQGCLWACNEPTSHSGCNLVRYCLAVRGKGAEFFQEVVESGSHQSSLAMLVDGQIDAAAIDSTVLELELRLRPELRQYIRVIETLGPSPIPPSVISTAVDPIVRRAIQQALLMMHADDEGRLVLASPSIARFVQVSDSDYDEIRSMAKKAHRVSFALTPLAARREHGRAGAALEC